jgi:adenylate cyclase
MLFLGIVLPTTDQAVTQEIEKRRVSDLFGRFVSPEMVAQLIGSRDLNSLNKRAELTILFSDIREFTQISEQLPPDEVVGLLNPYLDRMTRIIHNHGGTVDKYEGDAIVAFFGEPISHPDHAARAVNAAIAMHQALEELAGAWRNSGPYPGKLEMGVGINTGEVFVGLLGSEQRVNYTVIGDNVNLASRLQDETKELNWPILISGSTYEQVREQFEVEFAGTRLMRGKSEAVEIYKLIGPKGKM